MNVKHIWLLGFVLFAGCRDNAAQVHDAQAPEPVAIAGPQVKLPAVPLVISTKDRGSRRLNVEIATSPEQQQAGLMFRQSVGETDGMIFPMFPPRSASFWMKNTYIPLDVIFIGTDGRIAMISPNAKPRSLVPISTGYPVAGVLELAGGSATRMRLREGDRIAWGACAVKPQPSPSPLDPMNFCPAP